MVIEALDLCKDAIIACLGWFDAIMTQIDGLGVIVAAFIVVLTVTMFLLPLRGGGIGTFDYIADLTGQAIYNDKHSGKYRSGKTVHSSKYYRGKFEKGNNSAKLARNARNKK